MSKCKEHPGHSHKHGAGCGHQAVQHEGHTDYLHDGHLHYHHNGHVDDHTMAVSKANPCDCTPSHACGDHDTAHKHGTGCGHEAVPHGDHICYSVGGHLHRPHGGHCDDRGTLTLSV